MIIKSDQTQGFNKLNRKQDNKKRVEKHDQNRNKDKRGRMGHKIEYNQSGEVT